MQNDAYVICFDGKVSGYVDRAHANWGDLIIVGVSRVLFLSVTAAS
jgi:hypothetical protein